MLHGVSAAHISWLLVVPPGILKPDMPIVSHSIL